MPDSVAEQRHAPLDEVRPDDGRGEANEERDEERALHEGIGEESRHGPALITRPRS